MTGMTAPTPPTNPLTFTMPANDVAVNAVFEPLDELYTITVQTEGLGVVLGAPATAYAGTTVNMLALPLWPIASVDHWEVNGVNIGKTLVHSFVVAGNTTVKVVFK